MVKSFLTFITERFQLTLKYHSKLNPKLWRNEKPVTGMKEFLLRNSYKFAEFSRVPRGKIVDVIITGGNSNYNYTKYSDIDVHIIAKVTNEEAKALYQKKVEWTTKNKDLKFAGYPVEFYVEQLSEERPTGQGAYSLLHDKWISVPKHLNNLTALRDPGVLTKIKHEMHYIKVHLLRKGTAQEILDYKEKLWRMRTSGLQKGGEFSTENILYKDLRNRGLVDQLNTRLKALGHKE